MNANCIAQIKKGNKLVRNISKLIILWIVLMNATLIFAAPFKPRLVVLTDISSWETDDHESLIRLLAHADMFEIEGIIISTGYSIKTLTKSPEKDFINIAYGVIDAYEKDLPNLMKRSEQSGHIYDNTRQEVGYWPSAKYFRDRTMFGSLNRGVKFIGDDNDSPGSDFIIKQANEDDSRPLWVTVWGGGNTLAQSIYRVKKDKNTKHLEEFLHKIRVYAITDQDRHYKGEGLDVSSHWWIREQAGKDLMFIWDECAWKAHNGTGKSNWEQYANNIQNHGNMGSQYPKYKFGVEGDTPAFLYLIPNGLNDPEDPTQCSWGGTYRGDDNNLWQASDTCKEYFDRFYPAAFNNFAARMDWAKDGKGNRNPVIVIGNDKSISVQTKAPMPGEIVTLDASKSYDPDGDSLRYKWWVQKDAGTYQGIIDIENNDFSVAKLAVPTDSAGKCFHVICEVTDNGEHNLLSYQRFIFKPSSQEGVKAGQRITKANQTFKQWLFEYIPVQYPDAKVIDHHYWLQAFVPGDVVVNWTEWTDADSTFKAMEAHNLTPGKAMFVEQKGPKKELWANHPSVTHYEGAGYYCSGYDPATMRSWDGKGLTVIQFDGDCEELSQTIANAWRSTLKTKLTTSCSIDADACFGTTEKASDGKLKVSTVKLDGINTFKVETAMGVFHWECDPGKSGWMSVFDNNGKDWITAGPKQRGVGVNSQFRGLPNSGADDWGHPSRNWVHKKANVTSKVIGPSEGDRIIIESEGNTIKARWHCFNTHIAMEILELKSGQYHFLWEGTPGGTIHTDEGIITADGNVRKIKEGWFAETPDWPAGINGEWFIITDPNKKYNMWMAQTPATSDKGELWYQSGNMDLASFGRPDNKPTLTDTERKFAWGFIPYNWEFEKAKNHIETILKDPLNQKLSSEASAQQKYRVIMMSDFPPIGVVKEGNVPNNQKSDPDDMQSMVRFLLHANEFDIEGLVAGAGTFAMEARKKNILDVLDRYEIVYDNLKSYDSGYPTADYLRSVTYEGLGSNHGLRIKFGKNNQPWSDIIGEGLDSEASNAIIAAADKPDPRPLWIGVWGGPREVSQAIWRVRNDRSEEEFRAFIGKLRIFLIYYQDATHGWLMNEFPDLFIVESRKTYQGMFGGSDPISDLAWINENIRNNHGPLCEIYPHEGMGCTGVCEGDSPTFLHLLSANRGINNPEDPTQPGWGGQYNRKPSTNHYVDGPGVSSVSKWRKDYQNEFMNRADWCVTKKK